MRSCSCQIHERRVWKSRREADLAAIQLLRSAQFLFLIIASKTLALPVAPRPPPRNKQLADSWALRNPGTWGFFSAPITRAGRKHSARAARQEAQPRTWIPLSESLGALLRAGWPLLGCWRKGNEGKIVMRRTCEPAFLGRGGGSGPEVQPRCSRNPLGLCSVGPCSPLRAFAHPLLLEHHSSESITEKWGCATPRLRVPPSIRGKEGN